MTTAIGDNIAEAAALLQQGGLVAIPTETVYGLAANALNPEAVLSIFTTKGRPTFNPLIVHVPNAAHFERYATHVPPLVHQLAAQFCPGPLTFVLPKKSLVPDLVTGGGDTVALRVPHHPLTLALLGQLDFPLAAPSANPFGYISPVTAMHVYQQLQGKIAYILDGGPCQVGVESTVIAVEGNTIHILRAGGITAEDLRMAAPGADVQAQQWNGAQQPASPGMLKSHYAPKIKLHFGEMEALLHQFTGQRKALITFTNTYTNPEVLAQEVLSPTGNLQEAARNLFAAMRRLDDSGADVILAERFPQHGLGIAINDRLERASA